MQFVYVYKTSDGVRHEGDIESPTRDAAFAALRDRGIRPIKVLSKDGSRANGEVRGVRRRVVVFWVFFAALVSGMVAMWLGRGRDIQFYRADGSIGAAHGETPAAAMTRRQIVGDPQKVVDLIANGRRFLFARSAESYLAHYAQPGRPTGGQKDSIPSVDDFRDCLNHPIYTFAGEMRECAELKGIVAGMKEELRMFLASGGTVPEYLNRLEQRQKMEGDYLAKARRDLSESIAKALCVQGEARERELRRSYNLWRESNAWLGAMGIEHLAIPDELVEIDAEQNTEERQLLESPPVMIPRSNAK